MELTRWRDLPLSNAPLEASLLCVSFLMIMSDGSRYFTISCPQIIIDSAPQPEAIVVFGAQCGRGAVPTVLDLTNRGMEASKPYA